MSWFSSCGSGVRSLPGSSSGSYLASCTGSSVPFTDLVDRLFEMNRKSNVAVNISTTTTNRTAQRNFVRGIVPVFEDLIMFGKRDAPWCSYLPRAHGGVAPVGTPEPLMRSKVYILVHLLRFCWSSSPLEPSVSSQGPELRGLLLESRSVSALCSF